MILISLYLLSHLMSFFYFQKVPDKVNYTNVDDNHDLRDDAAATKDDNFFFHD